MIGEEKNQLKNWAYFEFFVEIIKKCHKIFVQEQKNESLNMVTLHVNLEQ